LWLALVLMLVIALARYGSVALALSSGPVATAYRRAKAAIERLCGLLMIGFGAKLAAGQGQKSAGDNVEAQVLPRAWASGWREAGKDVSSLTHSGGFTRSVSQVLLACQ
jgi:hypothetical protein